MRQITFIDVDTAFEEAKECSGLLDKLIQEANRLSEPDPQLAAQITGINKRYHELMHQYISIYRKRYGRLKERTVMIAL